MRRFFLVTTLLVAIGVAQAGDRAIAVNTLAPAIQTAVDASYPSAAITGA